MGRAERGRVSWRRRLWPCRRRALFEEFDEGSGFLAPGRADEAEAQAVADPGGDARSSSGASLIGRRADSKPQTGQTREPHGEFTKPSKQLPRKLSASENVRFSRKTESSDPIVCAKALTDANRGG